MDPAVLKAAVLEACQCNMHAQDPACMQGPSMIVPESVKPYPARGKPHPCEVCRLRIARKLGFEAGQARALTRLHALLSFSGMTSLLMHPRAPVAASPGFRAAQRWSSGCGQAGQGASGTSFRVRKPKSGDGLCQNRWCTRT
jgi:hypothetical protein